MESPNPVAAHYQLGGEQPGGLRERIEAALAERNTEQSPLSEADLSGAAEFHIGGRAASLHLVAQLGLDGRSEAHVLDIGSGLGGTARLTASRTGASVEGIDLTPEFVDVATWLSGLTGHAESTSFQVASATEPLPWSDHFHAATMLHVGMNIADKPALARTVCDALRPDAVFAIYDVMRGANPAPLDMPVPWASDPATSHVAAAGDYTDALESAGFEVALVEDRTAWAIEALRGAAPASPINLGLVMGPDTGTKVANMRANLADHRIAPTVIIAHKR